MEMSWTAKQKECLKNKIEESVQKNKRKSNFKDQLLVQCRRHGGLLTTIDEIQKLVKQTSDPKQLKLYLSSEAGFQNALHPFDARECDDLYKMNLYQLRNLLRTLPYCSMRPKTKLERTFHSQQEMKFTSC